MIDPKTINDAPQLQNIAETYRLALEAMTARAGEMEFNYLDHKRAYDALMINAIEFQGQIDTLKRRVLELEELRAPESVRSVINAQG